MGSDVERVARAIEHSLVACGVFKKADDWSYGPSSVAAQAAIAAVDACRWRPIESAPRDATVVLFYIPGQGHGVVRARADDRIYGAHWLENATHWQPLPAPPKEVG